MATCTAVLCLCLTLLNVYDRVSGMKPMGIPVVEKCDPSTEVYNNKCEAHCEPICGSSLGRVCDRRCEPMCNCKTGYVRKHLGGPCISACDCTTCAKNEVYRSLDNCTVPCEPTCKDRSPVCIEICVCGCFCKESYVREYQGGDCVPQNSCDSA